MGLRSAKDWGKIGQKSGDLARNYGFRGKARNWDLGRNASRGEAGRNESAGTAKFWLRENSLHEMRISPSPKDENS
jgi:hypothetical protein